MSILDTDDHLISRELLLESGYRNPTGSNVIYEKNTRTTTGPHEKVFSLLQMGDEWYWCSNHSIFEQVITMDDIKIREIVS